MSVISLLFKQSPTLAGYQFDATIEDTLEASVELTRYPVESGARVNDHRIINPTVYYLTGAVSNNPLKPMVTDFVGAGTNLDRNNPLVATVGGLFAGWLSGNDSTRASSTLQFLLDLMVAGLPFDVDAVDVQLKGMVITRLSRTRDLSTENGLIFVAQLQELITLDRLPELNQPGQNQLTDGDPVKSAAAAKTRRGQQIGVEPNEAVTFSVEEVLQFEGVDI